MTKAEYNKGLAVFMSFFPNLNWGEHNLDMFFTELGNLSPSQFEKAIRLVCRGTTEWYPTTGFVGKIIKATEDIGRQNWGSPERERFELPAHDSCANNPEFDAAMKMHRENRGKPDKESLARTREAQATMDRIQNAQSRAQTS